MAQSKSNTAAWVNESKAPQLEIKAADYPSPIETQIVVKTHTVAINSIDWKIQDMGTDMFSFLQYPLVLGWDVAGEVVEIGSGIKRFKVGDRVLGLSFGWSKNGGFQEYTVLDENVTSEIPDSLSYEEASVLPLGTCTAACGLFQKDFLALQDPSLDPKPTGETLLIAGGASSVGSNAIQLAVAAGYEIITTCSAKNFDFVKRLGASAAFDYNTDTVTQDIIEAFKGKKCAGAFAANRGTHEMCAEVLRNSEGKKFLVHTYRLSEDIDGIEMKFIFGCTLKDNEVGKLVFENFLPQALEQGKYEAAPKPRVVGKGFESIQKAFSIGKEGVSAEKIVINV